MTYTQSDIEAFSRVMAAATIMWESYLKSRVQDQWQDLA